MSRRTDGQPKREFPAQFHGQRKGLNDLQSAAPMAAGGSPSAPASPQQGPAPGGLGSGVFGPSERPGEPVSAGASLGAGPVPDDSAMADPIVTARLMYQQLPNKWLLYLINNG